MSAPSGNLAPIIVIKKKHGGEHGHHGGAWKVAYADFVTAMMAFFLLLWLLNVTTEDQKKAIANYFDPTSVSNSTSGSGGVMGGESITSPGAKMSDSSPMGTSIPMPGDPAVNPNDNDAQDKGGVVKNQKDKGKISDDQLKSAIAEKEDHNFKQAEAALREAIQSVPEMKELAKNLMVDETPEGLRIQLVDQEGSSMFPSASTEMYDKTKKLLSMVAQVVGKMPNQVTIRGHTDSTPYHSANGYNNWDLSSARANASRKALVDTGLDPARISSVVGKADKDPLFPENPNSPENRRISIILLRDSVVGANGADCVNPAVTGPKQKPD